MSAGDGRVSSLKAVRGEMVREGGRTRFVAQPDSSFEVRADLVLLAMGFVGPEPGGLLSNLGIRMTDRGNVWRDGNWMTSERGVFTAGDMQRGQSLIVGHCGRPQRRARCRCLLDGKVEPAGSGCVELELTNLSE
jgi:glutamate synthase (NADPH/NADH) small chain